MTDNTLILKPIIQSTEILTQLHSGQLLKVCGRRGSGIIICHCYHAELAGPGAAVGGIFDIDCREIIPVGKVALVYPQTKEERQKAYMVRQQWMRLTLKAMETHVPVQRAKTLLSLLERYLDSASVSQLPDDLVAQLIGVLPKTVRMARQGANYIADRMPQKVGLVAG